MHKKPILASRNALVAYLIDHLAIAIVFIFNILTIAIYASDIIEPKKIQIKVYLTIKIWDKRQILNGLNSELVFKYGMYEIF